MSVNSSTITRSAPADGSDPLAEAGQQAGQSVGHLAERAADIGFRQADRGKEQGLYVKGLKRGMAQKFSTRDGESLRWAALPGAAP